MSFPSSDGAGAGVPAAAGLDAADRWRDCLYLFPQLFGAPGGIQTVNGDTLRAMTRVCPSARHRVLLYQDREVPGLAVPGADRDRFATCPDREVPRPPPERAAGARMSFASYPDREVPGRAVPGADGDRVRFVPCGGPGGASRFRFAGAFAAALIERRPDLIVVGHAGLAPLAWLAKRALGIPYVVWIYGVEVGRLRTCAQRAGLRNADRLVAISRHTRRALAAVAPGAVGRTAIAPPAVRDHFRPGDAAEVRRRLGLDREPMLLTVARYDAGEGYKGYDRVLRALPAVLDRRPDVRYVLVGRGDDLPRVRALARELSVGRAVVFAGAAPDDALPAWYNACDLFVMPSRHEGFGIVFAEALACGKPVIAGDRDGARDALLDGRLGRLVDPDDAGRLAETILEFVTGRAPAALTDPEALSRECIRHFGFAAFERRVRDLVAGLDARSGAGSRRRPGCVK